MQEHQIESSQPPATTPEMTDAPEQLVDAFMVGRFQVVSASPEHGFQMYGDNEAKGVGVGFNISPREALLLGDFINQNRELFERGLQWERDSDAFSGEAAVSIDDGSGPEPIPTNRSVQ